MTEMPCRYSVEDCRGGCFALQAKLPRLHTSVGMRGVTSVDDKDDNDYQSLRIVMPNIQSDSSHVISFQIPEDGQTVKVRHRNWVVISVNSESLTGKINETQHLVTLESLEDDAFGEQLEVIWELEPGAYIVNKVSL